MPTTPLQIDDITAITIDAALHIHRTLGPGLLESVYESVLARALERQGLHIERHKVIAFDFDGLHFDDGFRVDLLVNEQVPIELKSVEKLSRLHGKQLLTYLRLLQLPVGLLINFGGATLREGLHRIVNHYEPTSTSRLRVIRAGAVRRDGSLEQTMPSPA